MSEHDIAGNTQALRSGWTPLKGLIFAIICAAPFAVISSYAYLKDYSQGHSGAVSPIIAFFAVPTAAITFIVFSLFAGAVFAGAAWCLARINSAGAARLVFSVILPFATFLSSTFLNYRMLEGLDASGKGEAKPSVMRDAVRYTEPGWEFSVGFPGKPRVVDTVAPDGSSRVHVVAFMFPGTGRRLVAISNQLPPNSPSPVTLAYAQATSQGLSVGMGARSLPCFSSKAGIFCDAQIDSLRGEEKTSGKMRFFFGRFSVLTLMVLGPASQPVGEEYLRFLDSVRMGGITAN